MENKMNTKPYKIYGKNIEYGALNQFFDAMKQDFVVKGALMPDAHQGYVLPIGAVIATKDIVVPAYVGYDISCGVCAYKTDFNKEDIENNKDEIFDAIYRNVPVGTNKRKTIPYIEQDITESIEFVCDMVGENYTDALLKCGTLGGGNHFIELGYDENNDVWIIIHSGSRHFGHSVASYFMKKAAVINVDKSKYSEDFDNNNKDFKIHNPEGFEIAKKKYIDKQVASCTKSNLEAHNGIDINTTLGGKYIFCLGVATEYALLNRKIMMQDIYNAISLILTAKGGSVDYNGVFINRNHNHAVKKDGLIIHRKGATHAEKGMLGVIPGNMRDGSFIVRGKGNMDSLCSSSHGAGRVLSRKKAKEQVNIDAFVDEMKGIKAKVGKSTLDESPFAYKNIFRVMEDQKDLVEVMHHVKPIINIKG